MSRLEEFREKARQKRNQETQEFLSNINTLHNNTDSLVNPSMEIMIESEKCYTNYHVVKYPNMLKYSISLYKKDYPFSLYYSKEWYKNDIPQKYLKQFEELEKYFLPA